MIKIQGGKLRGRSVLTRKGEDTRPTSAKSRSAIFDVLASRYELNQFEVLDLFAGTGAFSFEAISRGVKSAILVENDRFALQYLHKSVENLNLAAQCKVVGQDAVIWLQSSFWITSSKRLFFLDPPYQSNLVKQCLVELEAAKEQLAGSIVVIEVEKTQSLEYSSSFGSIQQKTYGKTRIDFLQLG